jgi:hypothetical protein
MFAMAALFPAARIAIDYRWAEPEYGRTHLCCIPPGNRTGSVKEKLTAAALQQLIRYARGSATALFTLVVLLGSLPATAQSQAPTAAAHFFNSLRGIHVVGYQGWYDCPGDGAGVGWGHWFVAGSNTEDPNSLAIDEWPDTSELGPDERCPTAFKLPSGAPAYLFSDQNPKTVARHFQWMRQYDISGAAMQRFTIALSNPALKRHFETVLANARASAEANGRGFFVMYDISGMNGGAALQAIEQDWPHLTGDLHLTESRAYIYDRGKPLVGVWGLGFKDRDTTPEQAAAIIQFLRTGKLPATVLGGVPAFWRTLNGDSRPDPQWAGVYRSLDVISPWAAGRFKDDKGADNFSQTRLVPDLAEAHRLGIEYLPVAFPGFSWHHGAGRATNSPLNVFPRLCGEFYRHQIANAVKAGADSLYTAMFDEVNEGTAIFKLVAESGQLPVGTDLIPLNANGCQHATSDMYLRMAGEATRALRAHR